MSKLKIQENLPAFGALCADFSARLGAPPEALASREQLSWIAASKRVFGLMREAGAPLDGVGFVAYDDRAVMAWVDRCLADCLERFAEPSELGRGAAMFEPLVSDKAGMFMRAIVGARSGPKEHEFWSKMKSAFRSDRAGRAFLLGHEAGHAIGHQKGKYAASKALLEAIDHPLAQSARKLVDNDDCPEMEMALMFSIEEAVCDAIGCWAAAKDGCLRAPESCLAIRGKHNAIHAYATGWLIRGLPRGEDLALMSFMSLSAEISAITATKGGALCEAFISEAQAAAASKVDEPVKEALSPLRKLSSFIFRRS